MIHASARVWIVVAFCGFIACAADLAFLALVFWVAPNSTSSVAIKASSIFVARSWNKALLYFCWPFLFGTGFATFARHIMPLYPAFSAVSKGIRLTVACFMTIYAPMLLSMKYGGTVATPFMIDGGVLTEVFVVLMAVTMYLSDQFWPKIRHY